jgi:hypothetical protein
MINTWISFWKIHRPHGASFAVQEASSGFLFFPSAVTLSPKEQQTQATFTYNCDFKGQQEHGASHI